MTSERSSYRGYRLAKRLCEQLWKYSTRIAGQRRCSLGITPDRLCFLANTPGSLQCWTILCESARPTDRREMSLPTAIWRWTVLILQVDDFRPLGLPSIRASADHREGSSIATLVGRETMKPKRAGQKPLGPPHKTVSQPLTKRSAHSGDPDPPAHRVWPHAGPRQARDAPALASRSLHDRVSTPVATCGYHRPPSDHMARANRLWDPERVRGELLKLGIASASERFRSTCEPSVPAGRPGRRGPPSSETMRRRSGARTRATAPNAFPGVSCPSRNVLRRITNSQRSKHEEVDDGTEISALHDARRDTDDPRRVEPGW